MPFDATLRTNISPLIDGQVPDYMSADHQVFVNFVKSYYEFLEAAELILTTTIDHLVQETVSVSYLFDETGGKIVTETGSGTIGKFVVNETITGGTSKATAKVLVDDLNSDTARIFITSQQKFIIGETITGGISEATAVIKSYRANPIQNIQQLQDFVDPDNSTDTFLDELVNQFIKIIPRTIASETSKRNLIKSIRDLYSAKGSSEATKLFLRILFDEEAQVTYPNRFMIRASKGDWVAPTVLRVTPATGSNGAAVIGQKVVGSTSGASALVVNSSSFQQGIYSVTELVIDTDSLIGTFTSGEIITANSLTEDVEMSFTVYPFINSVSITSGGALYSAGDKITLDSTIGNGFAEVQVGSVTTGGISSIEIKTEGSKYKIGDPIVFTPHADDTDVSTATAVVSVVGGAILSEDTDSTDGLDDYLVLQGATALHQAGSAFLLNDTPVENVLLEGTDITSKDSGHRLLNETDTLVQDSYSSSADRIVLEEETIDTSEIGAIKRIAIIKNGAGYTKLPTISSTSTEGINAVLFATSTDIGQVLAADLRDGGFNYEESPKSSFTGNFVLKNVTGSFAAGNSLTTHGGTVKTWDSARNLLSVAIDDHERFKQEFSGTYAQKLQLEQFDGDEDRFIANNVLENTTIDAFTGQERNMVVIGEDASLFGTLIGEGSSGLRFDAGILLDGTDSSGTDADDGLILDNAYHPNAGHAGYRVTLEDYYDTRIWLDGGTARAIDNHLIGDETTVNLITEAGDYLTSESVGQGILLEDHAGGDDYLIGETETFVDEFIIKEDTVSTNLPSYLNSETARDYLYESISDGTGTGIICSGNVAKLNLQTGVSSTSEGYFASTDHQVGEFTVRLQDSYYYQDFSYEVAIGQSTNAYLNELKGSIHPAGFIPFGKVSLASLLAAGINIPTAGDVVGFTADTTTFSPALASVLENIFGNTLRRRLGAVDNYVLGTLREQILLEDGEGIIIEDYLDGGRLMNEVASIIPSILSDGIGQAPRDVSLLSTAKVTMRLPPLFPFLGTGLKFFGTLPRITEFGGIELEDGYRTAGPTVMRDRLILDGDSYDNESSIINQGELMQLEEASNPNIDYGPSFNDVEMIDHFDIITESGEGENYLTYESATGPHIGDSRISTESVFSSTVTLGDLSRPSIILADDGTTTSGTDIDAIMPEDALDVQCATDRLVQEDGSRFVLQKRTGLQVGGGILLESTRFQLEDAADVGTIPSINNRKSKFPTFTRPAKVHIHTRGRIALQDDRTELTFVLEDGDKILLNGINSDGVDEGENLVSEKFSYQLHPQFHEGGFTLLNATDANGRNANGYLEYERGTWDSLAGSYEAFVEDAPERFSATDGFFDSSKLTFDISYGDG